MMLHGYSAAVSRWLRALVDTTGRLLIAVDAFNAALPAGTNNIGDVDVLTIAAGTNLIGRMDARSGDKLASFKAVYAEAILKLSTPAAGATLTGSTVPASTIRHITSAVAYNANTNPAAIEIFVNYSGISSHYLARAVLPGINGQAVFNGHVILRAGDNPFAIFGAGALNDDTHFRLCGWDESV